MGDRLMITMDTMENGRWVKIEFPKKISNLFVIDTTAFYSSRDLQFNRLIVVVTEDGKTYSMLFENETLATMNEAEFEFSKFFKEWKLVSGEILDIIPMGWQAMYGLMMLIKKDEKTIPEAKYWPAIADKIEIGSCNICSKISLEQCNVCTEIYCKQCFNKSH
jgi:hypothetical protein